jgi:hypothetical protein
MEWLLILVFGWGLLYGLRYLFIRHDEKKEEETMKKMREHFPDFYDEQKAKDRGKQ